MGVHHCNKVAEILQETKFVYVRDKSNESWTFEYAGAKLSLRIMPGCCGILHIYRISGKDRVAFRLLRVACNAARKANFGMVTLSLLANSPLRKFLGAEWVAAPFTNPRTRNDVEFLSYKLPVKLKAKPAVVYHEDN